MLEIDRGNPMSTKAQKHRLGLYLMSKDRQFLRNVTQESVITNSKQLKPKKSAEGCCLAIWLNPLLSQNQRKRKHGAPVVRTQCRQPRPCCCTSRRFRRFPFRRQVCGPSCVVCAWKQPRGSISALANHLTLSSGLTLFLALGRRERGGRGSRATLESPPVCSRQSSRSSRGPLGHGVRPPVRPPRPHRRRWVSAVSHFFQCVAREWPRSFPGEIAGDPAAWRNISRPAILRDASGLARAISNCGRALRSGLLHGVASPCPHGRRPV